MLFPHYPSEIIFQVCPICAATLGKDPIGHFTMQHGHSVKVTLSSHLQSMKYIYDEEINPLEIYRGGESLRNQAFGVMPLQ